MEEINIQYAQMFRYSLYIFTIVLYLIMLYNINIAREREVQKKIAKRSKKKY